MLFMDGRNLSLPKCGVLCRLAPKSAPADKPGADRTSARMEAAAAEK